MAVIFDGADGAAAVFDGGAVAVAVVLSATAVLGGATTGEQRTSTFLRAGRPHLPLAMSCRASSTSVSVQSDTCVPGQRITGRRSFVWSNSAAGIPVFG